LFEDAVLEADPVRWAATATCFSTRLKLVNEANKVTVVVLSIGIHL